MKRIAVGFWALSTACSLVSIIFSLSVIHCEPVPGLLEELRFVYMIAAGVALAAAAIIEAVRFFRK